MMHKSKRKTEMMEKVKVEVFISFRAVCNKRGVQCSKLDHERLMRQKECGWSQGSSITEDEAIERLAGLLPWCMVLASPRIVVFLKSGSEHYQQGISPLGTMKG